MKKIISIILCVCLRANATNYFVDGTATGSNNGTSWASAWTTLAAINWGIINGDDTIYIAAGTYGTLTVGDSGTSGHPITIRPSQDVNTGVATISGINFASNDYITLDGNYNGSQNLQMTGSGVVGGQSTTGIKILNMRFVPNGGGTFSDSNGPFFDVRYGDHYEIATNYIDTRLSIVGCTVNATTSDSAATGYGNSSIHDNTFIPNFYPGGASGAGPDVVQTGKSCDFYNNIILGKIGTGTYNSTTNQHQDFIQAQRQYLRVFNNLFSNSGDSAFDWDTFQGQPTDVMIYNNIFYGANGGMIRFYNSGGNPFTSVTRVSICNNTFIDLLYHHQWAISFQFFSGANPSVTSSRIQNNIIYNCEGSSDGNNPIYIEASTAASQADWNFDYNLINAGASGATGVTIDGSSYTQTHPRTAAPSFVSYVEGDNTSDYRLQSSDTAAKGQGVDLTSLGFTIDKNGSVRPNPPAIGAFVALGTSVTATHRALLLRLK